MVQQTRTRRTTSQSGRPFSVTIVLVCSMLMVKSSEIFTVPGMLPVLPEVSFTTAHLISCSIACSRRECVTVYHQDGNCTMGGVGMTSNISGPHILQEMSYTAPLSFRTLPKDLPTEGSSSANPDYLPPNAVDQNLTTWWCSGYTDVNSWWKLDLQGSFWVHGVDLLPRAGWDDYIFFYRVEVRVGSTEVRNGDFSAWTLFAFYQGPYQQNSGYINFTSAEGVFGKYITVRKGSYPPVGSLKLMDVRVTVRT